MATLPFLIIKMWYGYPCPVPTAPYFKCPSIIGGKGCLSVCFFLLANLRGLSSQIVVTQVPGYWIQPRIRNRHLEVSFSRSLTWIQISLLQPRLLIPVWSASPVEGPPTLKGLWGDFQVGRGSSLVQQKKAHHCAGLIPLSLPWTGGPKYTPTEKCHQGHCLSTVLSNYLSEPFPRLEFWAIPWHVVLKLKKMGFVTSSPKWSSLPDLWVNSWCLICWHPGHFYSLLSSLSCLRWTLIPYLSQVLSSSSFSFLNGEGVSPLDSWDLSPPVGLWSYAGANKRKMPDLTPWAPPPARLQCWWKATGHERTRAAFSYCS